MSTSSGVLGIDVASINSQKRIDWKRVAAWTAPDGRKIRFAIARAALGSVVDSEYKRNKEGALENGLFFGAYGVLKFDSPIALQVETCARTVGELSDRELPTALDFELEDGIPGGEGEHTAANAYIEALDRYNGRFNQVYTAAWFWLVVGNRADSPLTQRPLWVAHYTKAKAPLLPKGWHNYTIWQYSGNGGERVDGVFCDVDRNVFSGTEADLQLWIQTSKLSTPELPPVPPSVVELQTRLRDLGFDIGNSGPKQNGVDGIWGKKCANALRTFQKSVNIPETGILDAFTLSALFPKQATVEVPPGKSVETAPLIESLRGKE